MAAPPFPPNFKIIIFQKQNLPKDDLKDVIIHCRTINEFETILQENRSSNLTLVCNNDTFIDVAQLLLLNPNVGTVYILTDRIDIMWPVELEDSNFQCIKIKNEKQLMRHLCMKAMLSYFQQAEEHKKNGDNALVNSCLSDAKKALHQAKLFI